MLFNSNIFIYYFFPATLLGFFVIGRASPKVAASWLAAASLVFYGWWSIKLLPLLLFSVGLNYSVGLKVTPARDGGINDERRRRLILAAAIAANLALLGYFKYANFLISTANSLVGSEIWATLDIVLPIGISFYTFTQIAFLVDCWQGKVAERNLPHYLLFVSYFPHLVAGPVLHHKQMMPQFANPEVYRPNADKIALGLAIFIIGLGKKLMVGDPMGASADVLFEAARLGQVPSAAATWCGVLAYAFQIYFDFSGYSDMAIGLSLCFGIHLPLNFDSPYKAESIIDFWRRWHITLSTFLRDYLYIPLGGGRNGSVRRYANLLVTMLLGGLWHGASWVFVLWGAAHGLLLVINHLWRHVSGRLGLKLESPAARAACWLATFVAVCLAWVLFRADSLATAARIYAGMVGLGRSSTLADFHPAPVLAVVLAVTLATPNTQQLMGYSETPGTSLAPAAPRTTFRPLTPVVLGMLLLACCLLIAKPSPFLYFQF